MSKARKEREPLNEHALQYLEIRREVQRVMLTRLRHEDFRRQVGLPRVPRKLMASSARISAEHLGNLETATTMLTDRMRAQLMELCNLSPREWARREATIVNELPILAYPRRVELLEAAEPPASYGDGFEDEEQ